MSLTILVFNNPEENEECRDAQAGRRWRGVVHELADHLRTKIKHGDPHPAAAKALDEIRELLYETIDEEGLTL